MATGSSVTRRRVVGVAEPAAPGWGGRRARRGGGGGGGVCGSLCGAMVGLLLVLPACASLLWWGEGHSVRAARALDELAARAVPFEELRGTADAEGRVVLLSGAALAAKGPAEDRELGVSAPGALALRRRVSVYQWRETVRTEQNEEYNPDLDRVELAEYETVSYAPEWSERAPAPQAQFREPERAQPPNPPRAPFGGSATFEAPGLALGGLELGREALAQLLPPPRRRLAAHELGLALREGGGPPEGVREAAGGELAGADAAGRARPEIGDFRVSYETAPGPASGSAVGLVRGGRLVPFETAEGHPVLLAARGRATLREMVLVQAGSNSWTAWLVRGAGALGLYVAYTLALGPLSAVAGSVPLLGDVLRGAVGAAASVVAAALAVSTATLVAAAAWVRFRPEVAVALGAASLLALWMAGGPGRREAAAAGGGPPPAAPGGPRE